MEHTISNNTDDQLQEQTDLPTTPQEFADMWNVPYCEATGSFTYAVIGSRPNIAYATTAVSCFNENPGRVHWEAVKWIL